VKNSMRVLVSATAVADADASLVGFASAAQAGAPATPPVDTVYFGEVTNPAKALRVTPISVP
jgi:hypothetical protein